MKRHLPYQVCYVIAAVAAFGASADAAGIATVTDVVNEGYRTPPGHEEQTARTADELVQDEALRTDDGIVDPGEFVDGSELNVEFESQVVLSEYVFDGAASKGLLNLNDGLFHFTSNGQPDQGVKLKTPVATIGVRGTEFLVHVDGDDATIIDILSGVVEATPRRHAARRPPDRRPEHPRGRRGRGCHLRRPRVVSLRAAASPGPDRSARAGPQQ